MSYIFFALLAGTLAAFTGAIDGYILHSVLRTTWSGGGYERREFVHAIFAGWTGVVVTLVLTIIMTEIRLPPVSLLPYLLLTGSWGAIATIAYLSAQRGTAGASPDLINSLRRAGLLFVLVSAFLFLNEPLDWRIIGLGIMVVVGAVMVSLRGTVGALRPKTLFSQLDARTFVLIFVVGNVIRAGNSTLDKWLLTSRDLDPILYRLWSFTSLIVCLTLISGAMLIRGRVPVHKIVSRRYFLWATLLMFVMFGANVSFNFAIKQGPLTISSILGLVSVPVAFGVRRVGVRFRPDVFQQDREVLLVKGAGAVLIVMAIATIMWMYR